MIASAFLGRVRIRIRIRSCIAATAVHSGRLLARSRVAGSCCGPSLSPSPPWLLPPPAVNMSSSRFTSIGVSKPGCFPLFSGKVRIVSRTLSGLFLVGALNRPRKRKRTNRENPRTIPEQIGKIPKKSGKSQKGQKRTKKDKKGRTSPDRETPPFETPPFSGP